MKIKEYFTMGVKLYGVVLAFAAIPRLTQSLSYYLLIANSSSYSAPLTADFLGTKAYFLPELALIVFGILLFFKGEFLSSWAIPTDNELVTTDC